jgi:AcrR family transcriptional regulator
MNANAKQKVDGQKARSQATQAALMEAAEKLIARDGLHAISIKAIMREAGQKNESALQYHFGNLKGLISAIHKKRSAEIHTRRGELLNELLANGTKPDVSDLCRIMVMPTCQLAQEDPKFRRYVAGFGHQVALAQNSAFDVIRRSGGGGESGARTRELLRQALPHLDDDAFKKRMDLAARLCASSISHQANRKNAFKGKDADLFISHLVDALEGLLSAPVSEKTKKIGDSLL